MLSISYRNLWSLAIEKVYFFTLFSKMIFSKLPDLYGTNAVKSNACGNTFNNPFLFFFYYVSISGIIPKMYYMYVCFFRDE